MLISVYDIASLGPTRARIGGFSLSASATWDDAAIGVGDTEAGAYQDALDSLSLFGWDIAGMPNAVDAWLDGENVAPEGRRYCVIVRVRGHRCGCTACGCGEIATTTDDCDVPVCEDCAEYVVDDDGEVHCARCPEVEIVTETCGAGGQLRSYARLRPPDPPDADPEGEWACCWVASGVVRAVSRHATREGAEQAVEAMDWPPPGQEGRYLCGYEVRRLAGDQWVMPGDWED